MTTRAMTFALLLAATCALGACATAPTQISLADEESRCTRYGSLWSSDLGHCMHPGSR